MANRLAVFALVGLALVVMVQAEAETAETKTVTKVTAKPGKDKDEKLVQEEVNFYRALGFYNNYGGRGGFGYGQGQGNVGHNYGYSGYGHNSAPVSHNNGHNGYGLVQNQGGPQRSHLQNQNFGYPNGHNHIGFGQQSGQYGNQGFGLSHGPRYNPQHPNSIGPSGSQFGGHQGYGQMGGYYGGHAKGLYSSYVQPGYYGHLTNLGNGHGPNNNIGNHHNHPYNPYPHPTTHLQQNHHYPHGHYQQQHQQPIPTSGFAPQQEHFGYPVHQPQHAKDFGFQYQGQGHQAGNFFPNNNNGFQQNFGFNKKFY